MSSPDEYDYIDDAEIDDCEDYSDDLFDYQEADHEDLRFLQMAYPTMTTTLDDGCL